MKRYPGPDPFSQDYKDVFFGRDTEKDALLALVATNRFSVVFGRSGIGKSSLLNAAIIPELSDDYLILLLRFSSHPGKQADPHQPVIPPKPAFVELMKKMAPQEHFLANVDSVDQQSMWYCVKNLQKKESAGKKGLLIIMDQFEEVFSYDEDQVKAFSTGLSEVVNNRMPETIQRKLYKAIGKSTELPQEIKDDLKLIEAEPVLKIVVGIRSDRLSRLENFSTQIPSIFSNMLEIKQLTIDNAMQAIEGPASKNEPEGKKFDSEKFTYEPQAVEKILGYLRSKEDPKDNRVEAFQLQMICQRVEEMVMDKKFNGTKDGMVLVTADELPSFEKIVENYYRDFLFMRDKNGKLVFDDTDRLFIRYLVEKKLINAKNRSRLSLDQALVEPVGISEKMLSLLISKRIIRTEPNTVRGYSYEICHDTMVNSLLNSDHTLGYLDSLLEVYYRQTIQLEKDEKTGKIKTGNKYQEFVMQHLLTDEGMSRTKDVVIPGSVETAPHALEKMRIVRRYESSAGRHVMELYESFVQPALKVKTEIEANEKKSGKRRIKAMIFGLVSAALLICLMLGVLYTIGKARDKSDALLLVTEIDKIQDDKLALRLLVHAYQLYNDSSVIWDRISERFAAGLYGFGPNDRSKELHFPEEEINTTGISKNSGYFFLLISRAADPQVKEESPDQVINTETNLFGWKRRESLYKLRLYKFPSDSVIMFDSIVQAEFLHESDTLAFIKRENSGYSIHLFSAADGMIKSVKLPAKNEGYFNSGVEYFDQVYYEHVHFYYHARSKKLYMLYAPPLYNFSSDLIVDNPIYWYDENARQWKTEGNPDMYLFTWKRVGNSMMLLLNNSLRADADSSYTVLRLGEGMTNIDLPAGIDFAEFSNNGDLLFGTTHLSFFVADLKQRMALIPPSPQRTLRIRSNDRYLLTTVLSPGRDSCRFKVWDIRNKRLESVTSFSVIMGTDVHLLAHDNVAGYAILFPNFELMRVESTQFEWLKKKELSLFNLATLKAKDVYIDSNLYTRAAAILSLDNGGLLITKHNIFEGSKHMLYSFAGHKKDMFISKGGLLLDDMNWSPDAEWVLRPTGSGSVIIVDIKHKLSAFDVKRILESLKQSNSPVPQLTPAQKKQYQIRNRSIFSIF